MGKETPISKNDITLKLGYEFGEGDYIEFKAGRTDLDADVSYIGLTLKILPPILPAATTIPAG